MAFDFFFYIMICTGSLRRYAENILDLSILRSVLSFL